jgi:putative transposase
MARMGLAPIYQRPRTTVPHPGHRVWPYLLRDLVVERPNRVWCADITYIAMRRGFLYLVAVVEWATRKVLAWRVSNTMDVEFCISALEEALSRFGRPEIFNTDQGGQFTSPRFTDVLRAGLAKWIGYYNAGRPHSGLGGRTPDETYGAGETTRLAA